VTRRTTRFRSTTASESVVRADREAIWAALTDPVLLPKLTPFLHSIETDGDLWHWQLARIPVLGIDVVPAFTERMSFDEPRQIVFTHEPPPGRTERAGVEGRYGLVETAAGTRLSIELAVEVELPLGRLATPAVTMAMKGVTATMGARFAANLLHHIGAR